MIYNPYRLISIRIFYLGEQIMNENLKGVKRSNIVWEIKLDPSDPDYDTIKDNFESKTRKGYVNYPLAVENSKYGHCTITHLPTGVRLGDLIGAKNFMGAKKLLNHMVGVCHTDLLMSVTVDNIHTAKYAELKDKLLNILIMDSDDIPSFTEAEPMVALLKEDYYVDELKKLIPIKNAVKVSIDGDNWVRVDGKIIRSFLAKLSNDYYISDIRINTSHLLETRKVNGSYQSLLVKSGQYDCLEMTYRQSNKRYAGYMKNFSGKVNFKIID